MTDGARLMPTMNSGSEDGQPDNLSNKNPAAKFASALPNIGRGVTVSSGRDFPEKKIRALNP
jgi:hypothetical protein